MYKSVESADMYLSCLPQLKEMFLCVWQKLPSILSLLSEFCHGCSYGKYLSDIWLFAQRKLLEIFDLIFYIYLFCTFECFEGMYVCTPWTCRVGVRYQRTGVRNACKLSRGCWVSISSLLQELLLLLSTKPPFQSLFDCFPDGFTLQPWLALNLQCGGRLGWLWTLRGVSVPPSWVLRLVTLPHPRKLCEVMIKGGYWSLFE